MPKKILIIDDDLTMVKLLQSHFKKMEGFALCVAYDGSMGLAMARQERPDCIVLDVEMPRMDGYAFITALHKEDQLSSTPVIVLTSHEENQPIFQLKGVRGYLIKPVDLKILVDRISSVL